MKNPYQRAECPSCKTSIIRHVIEEGARYHVFRYSTKGRECSEKDCEENHICSPTQEGGPHA